MFKIILICSATAITLMFVFSMTRSVLLAQKSLVLVRDAIAFERDVPNASTRILVLGDSTAYGVGAEDTTLSTAGRLGALYPDAEVVNLAVSGLKIEGLNKILSEIDSAERYDIVLIQIGANDIIRFTSMENIEAGIEKVLARAEKFGGRVIVLHSGDIGEAKFFPWFVQSLLTSRSYETRRIYERVATLHSAHYVDLIDSPSDTLLHDNPKQYYAKDYLHLSGEGYGLWFDEIRKFLVPVSASQENLTP